MIFLEFKENFYCHLCLARYEGIVKRINHENGHIDFEKSFITFSHSGTDTECPNKDIKVKKLLGKYLVSDFYED